MYSDGPLKGIGNGDRMYKIELSPNSYLGIYHVIDGQRVTAKYKGQQPTCARCFGTPQSCPGKGLARRCELEGGLKKEFDDYIFQLWDDIGYVPSNVELGSDNELDLDISDCKQFTPVKTTSQDPCKFNGVRISSFPRETDHGLITEFIIYSGMPDEYKDNVSIKNNGTVMIEGLPNNICLDLIAAVHGNTSFGSKLYCNGVIPRTPDKTDHKEELAHSSVPLVSISPANQQDQLQADPTGVPSPLSPMSPNTFSQQYSETPDFNLQLLSNVDLARRHSLSLRTPPRGSLGEQLLNSEPESQQFTKVKNMLSNIKDMAERFSEFASCESLSDDGGTDTQNNESFKLQGRKKKTKKHKLSPSPTKEFFLKKQNTRKSPVNSVHSSPVDLVKDSPNIDK